MLLWIFIFKFLCEHSFSFLLGIYPGVERYNFLQCLFFFSYLERALSLVMYSELERTLVRRQEMWVKVLGLLLTGHLLGNSLFPQLYNEVLSFIIQSLRSLPS